MSKPFGVPTPGWRTTMWRWSRVNNPRDLTVGLLYVAAGLGFAAKAWWSYELGTGARMGPGYFPVLLGLVLVGLGITVGLRALHPNAPTVRTERWDWRSLLWMTGSVALFGLTLPWLGLVVSVALLVLVSSRASHEFTWRGALGAALSLAILNYLVFVRGLGLPFQAWPAFLVA